MLVSKQSWQLKVIYENTEDTKHILNREKFVYMFVQIYIYIHIQLFTRLNDTHLINVGLGAQFSLVFFFCFKV